MQKEAVKQRVHYLMEHGGLWEPEHNQRVHVWLVRLVAVTAVLQIIDIIETYLLR